MHAITAQRLFPRRLGVAQHRAQSRRGFEKLRRLALDHVEVPALIERHVAGVHQLQHFTFRDHVGRIGKNGQHAHPADADHQLKRARIKKIANQHRRGIAERRVGGRMTAAQLRFVDDVVVQKRRGMNHLDHRGQRVMIATAIAARARYQKQHAGPQPLAAAAYDVFGDLADQRYVGREAVAQNAVDFRHVGADDGFKKTGGHVDGKR